ncbi:MAG: glutamate--tRNA ligase [Patescibacteria group bacterium]
MIKTRFAPSPTGYLHVGGLRTALFSYLFAKKNNGIFVLRVEDTDRERLVEGGLENIIRSLQWAGIFIDEGVDIGDDNRLIQKGESGPYIQSERLEKYHKYVQELLNNNHAYPCFCAKERLAELRQYQELNKLPTGYDGACRDIDKEESAKRINSGETHVIRMKMPRTGTTEFDDLVHGRVEFQNNLIDDQVILKSDGYPTYHFAVVVDDHLMGITHIIRGDEWISSTPKHLELYRMFHWETPAFAHLPLILNPDKSKLSKRQGDVAVGDYHDKGYLPEALVNFVAFLGWNPGDDRELFSLKELTGEFNIERVMKAGAVFNLEKLNWYNQQYLRALPLTELTELCKPFFAATGLNDLDFDWLTSVVALEKDRASTLVEIVENTKFIFTENLEYDQTILVWKKSTPEQTKANLKKLRELLNTIDTQNWNKEKLEALILGWIKETEQGVGDILCPMRVALSGQKNSPGPFEIAAVLGKEKSLDRIARALAMI